MPPRHDRRPRLFVVGAYTPNGGTHMAYQVARLFAQEFAFEVIAVTVSDETPERGIFTYDPIFPSVSIAELERTISASDVLLANLGHSRFLFGPRIAGRKLMYAQGFTNARPLDCSYDCYVSVSEFVQRFLRNVYAIESPIIPAFVDASALPPVSSWDERSPGSIVVHAKRDADLDALRAAMRAQGLTVELERLLPHGLPQPQFTGRIAAARYLVNVATAEGFGLVSLEAMALGTVVIGFDGFGGRDYMNDGKNCACTSYPDYGGLAERIGRFTGDSRLARDLLEPARLTARRYGYANFQAAWIDRIERFLAATS